MGVLKKVSGFIIMMVVLLCQTMLWAQTTTTIQVTPVGIHCQGDTVILTAPECQSGQVIMEEGFERITSGTESTPGSSVIPNNTLLKFPNMSYVYPAGGKVKMGSSSNPGSMISMPLDLSNPFRVVIYAKSWTGKNGVLIVSVDGNDQQQRTVGQSDYDVYSFDFQAATAMSTITIKTMDTPQGRRVFIDSVVVESVGGGECTYLWSPGGQASQSIEVVLQNDTVITLQQSDGNTTSVATFSWKNPVRMEVDEPLTSVICPGDEVTLSSVCHDEVLLTEGFSSITDGGDEGASAPGGIPMPDSTLATFPTMSNVYPAGGKVKFGKGSGISNSPAVPGSMTSVPLDLSHSFDVIIKAKNWAWGGYEGGNRDGIIKVTAGTESQQQTINTIDYIDYVFHFPAIGSLTPITIESVIAGESPTSAVNGWRFFIDSVTIRQDEECTFLWTSSPSLYIDNPTAQSIMVNPVETTLITLRKSNQGCSADTSIVVSVYEEPVTIEEQSVCEDDLPFTWHGVDYTTVPTEAPRDTIVGGSSTGCDSIVTLHLTIYRATNLSFSKDTCDRYTWRGKTYTESGDYKDTLTDGNGCTQVDTLHLTIYRATNLSFSKDTCDRYTWRGKTYTESGEYRDTLTDGNGCTQVDTLHLTIYRATNLSFSKDTCDRYTWRGKTYAESGDYKDTLTDGNGCTQVDTLHLTIYRATNLSFSKDTCDRYTWRGKIYTENGDYKDTLTDGNGCTQVDTLHLTVHHAAHEHFTESACETYTWHRPDGTDTTITDSGDYLYRHSDANGCQQVDTLHLTINHSKTGDTTATACDSFNWYGHTGITASCDNLTHTFASTSGCDSVVTLHLTINHSKTGDTTATACDSFDWYEHTGITSSTNSLTHTFTSASGCDSVVTLHLTINHSKTDDTTATACDSFDWYEHTGITVSCNNLTHTFASTSGCDSVVTLHLTINHSKTGDTTATACDSFDWYEHTGITSSCDNLTHTFTSTSGCDSVVTLHLTINHSSTGDTTANAQDSFTWYEHANISQTGNYTHTFVNTAGCDSVVTLHLTIGHSSLGDTTAVACDTFDWYEHTSITQSGNYTHTFTNVAGYDSVVTLHLTINHSKTGDTTATACDSFNWYEHTGITSSTNSLTHTFASASGCDSVVTLHLTINHSKTGDTTATACDSFDWYEHAGITSSTNSLTHTFTNSSGCDSVVTLHLTINHSKTGDTTATACDSFDWYEHTGITTSCDNLTHTFTNTSGCDSVVTLHLTINHSKTGDTTAIACDSFDWYEHTGITSSTNSLTRTFTNTSGCDSVVTLHLTINHSSTGDTTANVQDSFTWYEHANISQTGNYTHTFVNAAGCDSVVTLHLTIGHSSLGDTTAVACDTFDWYEHTGITQSGNYTHTFTNVAGYDSVVTLHLTINHSKTGDTTATACDSFDWYEHTGITSSTNSLTHTFTSTSGCDSVVTLHLTINHSKTGDTTAIACDSFDWYEHTGITSSTNSLTHTFASASGCDSVVTLHLTINHSKTGDTTVVACNRFTWHGVEYTETPAVAPTHTYRTEHGCDSVVTLHLTINQTPVVTISGETAVTTGNSTTLTATGADSYQWSTGDTSAAITETPSATTTYTVVGTTDGCSSDPVSVTVIVSECEPRIGDTTAVACDIFTWYGTDYTSSTEIATHVFEGVMPDGCDSVVRLHLTINQKVTEIVEATACDSFVWHGRTFYGSTDTATFRTTRALGCDSVVTLHLTINHSNTGDTTAVACDSFDWYEHTNITASCDNLTHTFTNANGCDSVVTLHLTINHSSTGDTTAIACDSFDWYEHTGITSSTNSLTHTFTNTSGCDSVVTLHLTVNYSNTGDTTANAQDSFTWYEHANITQTGNYTHTFVNAAGCDSVVTLHLTIGQSSLGDTSAVACDSFDWYEHTGITQSGNYTHTFTNVAGYDSVVTLHLTINHSSIGDTTATACDSFVWHGRTFYESTDTATYRTTNAVGCDSLVILHLTVNHSSQAIETVTACDSFIWHDRTFYESADTATYHTTNALGCDSVVILHLTINPSYNQNESLTILDNQLPYTWRDTTFQVGTLSGSYTFNRQSVNGCDSIVILNLTITVSPNPPDPPDPPDPPAPPQPDPIQPALLLSEMLLPNAITPSNSDGLNDCFQLPEAYLEQIAENDFEIIIYNRWGETVFYSKDKYFRWYGDYKGSVCKEQVFGYKLVFFNLDGIIYRKKGSFVVL